MGPLLFNIFIVDLFSIMKSYFDYNTPYVIADGVIQLTESLKEPSDKLFSWFANNQMKANPDKSVCNR